MNFGRAEKPPFYFYNTANHTIYAIPVKMLGFPPTLKHIFTQFQSEDQLFYF